MKMIKTKEKQKLEEWCNCNSQKYYFQLDKCWCPDCNKLIKSKYIKK